MSTYFKNALLLDYDPARVVSGGLRVEDGTIVDVGSRATPQPDDEILDCGGAVLMPGLVNGHTHLYSALAAGMPSPPRTPTHFHEILKFVWWRLDRALDAQSIEAGAVVGALDALRHGTTTLIDHHASPNHIDGSLDLLECGIRNVGLRGVLCYEATDRNGEDGAKAGLEENRRYMERCRARADGRFAALVGAHASFTIEDSTLSALAELAGASGVGVHIHLAEDACDDLLSRESFGEGAVDRLDRAGVLTPSTILAHCIHLSDEQRARIHEAGSTIAHNPRSNMNNGVGYAPVARIENPVVLGTDGIGSDMFAEARFACFKANDAGGGVGPDRILHMWGASARRASDALGIVLGKLEAGAVADLVLTDYVPPTPLTSANAAGHLLFAMDGTHVRDVMTGGNWRLRDGRPTGVCVEEEARRASAAATCMWKRMADIPC